MNSTPLFVLFFILLSACSPKQNTDFIVDDYLKNIQILEENNEFLKERITKVFDARPIRERIHKENITLFNFQLNSLFSEIDSLIKDQKSDLTKSELNRIYDTSLGLTNLIEGKLTEKSTDEYRLENIHKIFEGITNDTFWKELINETNKNTLKIAFVKLKLELKICENNLFKFYDMILNKKVLVCPGPNAMVIAPTSYVMSGTYFEAEIHLLSHGYFNRVELIRIVVNDKEIPINNGRGDYKVKAPGYAGIHPVKGYIEINGPEGIETHPFNYEWQSFVPAVSFEFYEYQKIKSSEETEFIVNIPGFRQEDLIVETSKGKLTKQKGIGKYKIWVDEKPNTQFQIKVSVKMPDGSIRKMGERKMECTE